MELFFPRIADRLKMKINVTPNFATMATGHGNIKSYVHKLPNVLLQKGRKKQ